ncbi:hypothetical protein WKI65_44440 [Streptomyces sp. MS1.AVA.3]|uniref:hypothetical protein n=1 Tax=Streptomyces decoyicus TaxID=249567 RepID=UPI0030C3CCBF
MAMHAESVELTDEEHELLCRENTARLGLEPRLLRLLTAVHEAGHAIVGHTVGFKVNGAFVTSTDVLGRHGGDHISVDLTPLEDDGIVPLCEVLALKMAGFQASHTWLRGRGVPAMEQPYKTALNTLAGGDISQCYEHCNEVGMPDVSTTREALYGAAIVLKFRWRAVLRLAYALDTVGVLDEAALQPYLEADPAAHQEAADRYRAWRQRTSDLWLVREHVDAGEGSA